jgi:formylglycine-generating enzyme required for sulfatase activity
MNDITLNQYLNFNDEKRIELSEKILSKFQKELIFKGILKRNKYKLLSFSLEKTGIDFVYIPSGTFVMGFSKEDEKEANKISSPPPLNIEEMRPVQNLHIQGFLVSITPLLNIHAENISKHYPIDLMLEKDKDLFCSPFLCEYGVATEIASILQMSLPSEKEWEYFCRGNTNTLFCFGNNLPKEDELESWMSWDLSLLDKLRANDFGLYGLFFGEWCIDDFRITLEENAEIISGAKVIKGGGAYFWPWQDEEWVGCMSSFRMPSVDLIDNNAAFRLIYHIGNVSN